MVDTEDGIMMVGSKNKRLCRQDSDGEESESALRALALAQSLGRGTGGLVGLGKGDLVVGGF